MKVQAESFHLNGHIIGFRPQTQKLELPHKTLSNTLAVKGLREVKGFALEQLSGFVSFKSSSCTLRLPVTLTVLFMPLVRTKSKLGDRTFTIAALTLLNSLPRKLRVYS